MKLTIKAARINAGLTQLELAKLMNVDITTISSWERYATEMKISQACKFAKIVNIPVDNLKFF